MSKMPWVRFFASDWLAGTRGMSAVETGIYITLIASMYERGEPLAEDHPRLARLCGASNSSFKTTLETLIADGKITRTGEGLWNDRVEKERVYLSEKSEVGFKAAKARWDKKTNKNNSATDADAMPVQSGGNANQKPEARSHIKEKEDDKSSSKSLPQKSEIDEFLKAYSAMAIQSGLSIPRAISTNRRTRIAAKIRAHGLPVCLEAIQRVGQSRFCTGQNERGWKADLDFVLQDKSFLGLLEGKYENRDPVSQAPPRKPTMADFTGALLREMTNPQEPHHEPDYQNRPTIDASHAAGDYPALGSAVPKLTAS